MSQIEITDVERLTLRPGDALVVRVPHKVTPPTARIIIERVRAALELDETTPVLVLDGNMSVDVVEQPREISR